MHLQAWQRQLHSVSLQAFHAYLVSLVHSRFSRDELSSLKAGFNKICGPEHTLDKPAFLVSINPTTA